MHMTAYFTNTFVSLVQFCVQQHSSSLVFATALPCISRMLSDNLQKR